MHIRFMFALGLGAAALLASGVARGAAPASATPAAAEGFEFFPLDNGVGRGEWTPEKQAATVKELGFGGIGYNYTTPQALESWLKELRPRGLKLYSLYFGLILDKPDPYPAGLAQAIAMLKGSETIVWVMVPKTSLKGDVEGELVKRLRALADLSAASGLRVAIYPHFDCTVATAEQALGIAEKVDRKNVGVTVNLCHELAGGNGPRLAEIIKKAGPRLSLVSLCGASDKPGKLWDNYIQTLDRGDYDVYGMLQALRAAGYSGPMGLQCYSIKGDPRENLVKSMNAWKKYMARMTQEKQQ